MEMSKKLPVRDVYTVKMLLNDLKKMKLTPSGLYTIGTEVVYYEWQMAIDNLGENDPIVVYLEELLNFMQTDYERRLVEGDLRREKDTPGATINSFLKETPLEFQSYVLQRSGEFISGVLRAAQVINKREIERYDRIENRLSAELEENPDNPELWNQLRLALWILGRYDEASFAFKQAKKLGWDKGKSRTVAV
jgi:tetratricopeptide (TPR) repeat protein